MNTPTHIYSRVGSYSSNLFALESRVGYIFNDSFNRSKIPPVDRIVKFLIRCVYHFHLTPIESYVFNFDYSHLDVH